MEFVYTGSSDAQVSEAIVRLHLHARSSASGHHDGAGATHALDSTGRALLNFATTVT